MLELRSYAYPVSALLLWVSLLPGCALGPRDFEYPPLLNLDGEVHLVEGQSTDDEPARLVLSWYLFRLSATHPVPWSVADETELVLDSDAPHGYRLSLLESPPAEAFLTAQDHPDFEEIEARGRFAVGFLTAIVGMHDDLPFQWTRSVDDQDHYPIKNLLVVWWDGESFDGNIIGFEGGQVRAGLNVVQVIQGAEEGTEPQYILHPAIDGIPPFTIDLDRQEARSSACAFPIDIESLTILPDAEGHTAAPIDLVTYDRLEDAENYQCQYSGRVYEMPLQCRRLLNVICSECHVASVHVDPENVPDDWPCVPTAESCRHMDVEDSEMCVLGRIYSCDDEGEPYVERECQAGDYACSGECVASESMDRAEKKGDEAK